MQLCSKIRKATKRRSYLSLCYKVFLIWLAYFFFTSYIQITWFNDPRNLNSEQLCLDGNRSPITKKTPEHAQRRCLPISAMKCLSNENSPSNHKGTFLETVERPRELARFLHEPSAVRELPQQCKHLEKEILVKIAMFVKSGVSNFDRRKAIRDTWGSIKVVSSTLIKVVFLVGKSSDENEQEILNGEIQKYQDIIQIDVEDTYKTVAKKVLAGMQWSSQYLTPEWVYASVDDDMVIYVPNLVKYLDLLIQPNNEEIPNIPPCYQDLPIVCAYNYKPRDAPDRDPFSKWYISRSEYSDNTWPTYCRGGMYMMSNKLVADLFVQSRTTPYLYLDDVWITGLMRLKLKKGDGNIMGAPYSSMKDNMILNMFHDDGGSKAFVKHLWGNINFWFYVDPAVEMRREWRDWNSKSQWTDRCVSEIHRLA